MAKKSKVVNNQHKIKLSNRLYEKRKSLLEKINDSDLRTIFSSNGHAAELSLSEPGSNINSLVLLHLK